LEDPTLTSLQRLVQSKARPLPDLLHPSWGTHPPWLCLRDSGQASQGGEKERQGEERKEKGESEARVMAANTLWALPKNKICLTTAGEA
jgi:hypothetical protein